MRIARWAGAGLGIAVLALLVIAAAPWQAWANGGEGIRYNPTIIYDEDADDDDESESVPVLRATPSPYSVPEGFDLTYRPKFSFGTSLRAEATYRIKLNSDVSEDTEEPTTYTMDGSDISFKYGLENFRIRWRFPEYADSEENEETKKDEPISSSMRIRIGYKYSSWVNDDVLVALDEEEETETTDNPYRFTIPEEMQERVRKMVTQLSVSRWLGDDAYDKLQEEFGPADDGSGATDFSDWNGAMYYCGGACVGRTY